MPANQATATQASNSYINVNASDVASNSVVGMSIVPVKVKAKGQNQSMQSYAFLDSSSNTSFCTENLLKQLGVSGKKTHLSLTTMQTANEQVLCSSVDLEVSDLNGGNTVELPIVYSRPSLPDSTEAIAKQEDVNRWPHLNGIKLPANLNAEIGLLIGSDAPRILQPIEVREGKHGGPFATQTVFGWTLNGPLGGKQPKMPTANFIETTADLSKRFEDFCNLEFNDSTYKLK